MEEIPRLIFFSSSQLSILCIQLTKPNTSLNWALAPAGDKAEETLAEAGSTPYLEAGGRKAFPHKPRLPACFPSHTHLSALPDWHLHALQYQSPFWEASRCPVLRSQSS